MKTVNLIILAFVLTNAPISTAGLHTASGAVGMKKSSAIDPGKQDVGIKAIFVTFEEQKPVPDDALQVFAMISGFISEMSFGKQAVSFDVFRRPPPNQDLAWRANHPAEFYWNTTEQFHGKIGILQKEIFEHVYNDDTTAFVNVEFIVFVLLEPVFLGYTGMSHLGAFNDAGFPTDIYRGTGVTVHWLDTPAANGYHIAHEYGHQIGLHHPPQNEAHRYYGWYSLMYNRYLGEPGIRPVAAPQYAFNDLWLESGDLVMINKDMKKAEIPPFFNSRRIYAYADQDMNAFIMANYQGTGCDSIYDGRGLLIWHTSGYNVWDIEAAHGNWENGEPGGTPSPDGPPDGFDLLDRKTADYHTGPGDFFDGKTYTSFTSATNPNTNLYPADTSTAAPYSSLYSDTVRTQRQEIVSRFAMLNLRPKAISGPDTAILVADFYVNNWTGRITENTTWSQNVHVSGDVIVDPGVTLIIARGVRVVFEPLFDDRRGGDYTDKGEIIVEGTLDIRGTAAFPVVFTSGADSPAAGDWGSISVSGALVGSSYRYEYASEDVVYK